MKIKSKQKKKIEGTYKPSRDKNITPGRIELQKEADNSREGIKTAIVEYLNRYGLTEQVDLLLVDALARELSVYHTCMDIVEQEGAVRSFENGKQTLHQIHPQYKAAKIALGNALSISKDFGLTAKSRLLMAAHRIEGNDLAEDKHDPAAGFLGGPPDVIINAMNKRKRKG